MNEPSSDSKDETEGNDGIDTEVVEALDRLEGLLYDVEASIDEVKTDIVDEDQLENIVSNRSYRAVEYVLEDNDLLDDETYDQFA